VYLLHTNFIKVHFSLLKLMYNGTRGQMSLGLKIWAVACTDSVSSAYVSEST
jgi:hypothetical protein